MPKYFVLPFVSVLLWLMAVTSSAAEHTYNILLLQSYTRNTPGCTELTESLKEGLKAKGLKARVVTEYLNADYWTYSSECFIMRRICNRARERHTDLIVTAGDEAFYTLTHCGDSLPYQIPVVTTGIKFPDREFMETMPNVCGYTSEPDFEGLLRESIRLFPGRRCMACLSDSSFLSTKGVKAVKESWESIKSEYPDYNLIELNVQNKDMNLIVTSLCYDYNAYKYTIIAPKWIPFFNLEFRAPIFSTQTQSMTRGVFSIFDVAAGEDCFQAANLVSEILRGRQTPASIGIKQLDGYWMFFYDKLNEYQIPMERVESNGVVLGIPFSKRYGFILVICYLLILAGLISLVIWLIHVNRQEYNKRMHAQARLLLQNHMVEQRNEFDNLLSSIRDGVITYDVDLRIHFANNSLLQMLGVPYEENQNRIYEGQVAGSLVGIILNGEDLLLDMLKQVRSEKKPIRIPEKAFMRETSSGHYFPVSGEVAPIFAQGKLTGMAIVCRNITEEEKQKRLFELAFEGSAIYSWQYVMSTESFYFQNELLERFGFPPVEDGGVAREKLLALIHPDDLKAEHDRMEAIFLGHGLHSRLTFRVQNAQGDYEWWEFRSTDYDGMTETPYMILGVCQSIQSYKDTEEALIVARDRALQADKLKSAFLANMSHEIRTPLNSIVGFSDLLKDLDSFSREEINQFVSTINNNCTLLLALISDILDLSRIESGTMDFKFADSDIFSIFHQVYDSQKLNMPAGVELRLELPEGDADKFVCTDIVRLKQVVNNLVNNAKKFTSEGHITFGYRTDVPGHTTIFVKDTGCGISEEAQKHIFERFYKEDSFTQGAGLGLSICQTIVQRLHGTISVASEMDKGTCFEVRIPDSNDE